MRGEASPHRAERERGVLGIEPVTALSNDADGAARLRGDALREKRWKFEANSMSSHRIIVAKSRAGACPARTSTTPLALLRRADALQESSSRSSLSARASRDGCRASALRTSLVFRVGVASPS